MRKFADKEQRTDRHGIQTLRPLYPLWILEGAGQLENLLTIKEQRTDRHGIQTLRPLYPLWILEGAGQFFIYRADGQSIILKTLLNDTIQIQNYYSMTF